MTPVERLLAELPDARPSGAGWSARCPAHDDRTASLSVAEGDDGRALVKCHAGCPFEAVLDAVELTPRDLMPDRPAPPSRRAGHPKPAGRTFPTAAAAVANLERRHGQQAAAWAYTDAAGEPVGLAVRWNRAGGGKDVRPVARHPDGWHIGAMPAPRPLYRLPDLAAAGLVLVCEGEPAADAARSLGYTATTSSGGAQAAGKTDWSPLAGKTVLILPDNDPAGRKYAADVTAALAALSPPAAVRVVELPGLPAGGDLVDWVAARGDAAEPDTLRAELESLAAAAATAHPPADPVGPTDPADPGWPDPMADEAFYGLAGDIVRVLDPGSEADPAAVLVQLLVMFGNVIGRGPHFKVGPTPHRGNLFALLVGPTGTGRKGTALEAVRAVFDGLDDDWLLRRSAGGVASGEGLKWAVRDPVVKREKVAQGRGAPPRYEAVEADPGVADKRLLVTEPEFAGVLKVIERPGNTASPVLRQLWDSPPVVGSLTKTDPTTVTGPHVSVVGHVTPEEFARCLTTTEAANGYVNRHLIALVRRSKVLPDGGAVDPGGLAAVRARLVEAVAAARTAGEVVRHPSARGLWHAVYRLLTGDRPGLVGALTARAAPQVLRLALVYALLDRSADIRRPHLLAAVAVWDYCERSVAALFGDRTGDPVADEVRDLLRAAPGGLTRTELVAALGRHHHGDRLTRSLGVLERVGLARRETVATGGRPAERWHAVRGGAAGSALMAAARAAADRERSDGSD